MLVKYFKCSSIKLSAFNLYIGGFLYILVNADIGTSVMLKN